MEATPDEKPRSVSNVDPSWRYNLAPSAFLGEAGKGVQIEKQKSTNSKPAYPFVQHCTSILESRVRGD